MFIHEYGSRDNPTVILLAPMMVSGEDLYTLMSPYFNGSYHFIAPDQGGHGKAGAYTSADAEYRELKSFLLETGCKRIELVYGASLGVAVGYRLFLGPDFSVDHITGTNITNTNNPAHYVYRTFQPAEDGFFIIQKDNAGTANLKTFVFSLPDLVDGNVVLPHSGVLQPLTVRANGSYTPGIGIDGFSGVTVDVPTEASTLVAKTVTANGEYDPEDDGVDGYSALTVDVHPGLVTPYAFDLDTGYVYYDNWKLGGDTVNYTDVYQVTAGEWYIISLGSTVGSRFRALFTTEDTTQAVEDIPGSRVVYKSNPSARDYVYYKPSSDGYITITKDNAGTAGLKTYVYTGSSLALSNP